MILYFGNIFINQDAWMKDNATKIGYKISFTRHFYKPKPLRSFKEIQEEIGNVRKDAKGTLDGLLEGVK